MESNPGIEEQREDTSNKRESQFFSIHLAVRIITIVVFVAYYAPYLSEDQLIVSYSWWSLVQRTSGVNSFEVTAKNGTPDEKVC